MRKVVRIFAVSIALFLFAHSGFAEEFDDGRPLGVDVGVVINDHYPYSTLGQVQIFLEKGASICSGALVARDIVLTAAHCFKSSDRKKIELKKIKSVDFWPIKYGVNANKSRFSDPAHIDAKLISYHLDSNNGQDWALLKLDLPIGDQRGWLGVQSLPASALERIPRDKAKLVGFYNSINTAFIHHDCKYVGDSNNKLNAVGFSKFDCKFGNDAGDSGGPVLYYSQRDKGWYAIGVISRFLVFFEVTYASKMNKAVNQLRSLK